MQASGTFDVTLTTQEHQEGVGDASIIRMSISKVFHGDLEGRSLGQMLSALTGVSGSAGYVAIERVEGTLGGRSGAFVLQHNGVMNRGEQGVTIAVIPDSGTGELAGITGSMTISIAEGRHSYTLDYTLGTPA